MKQRIGFVSNSSSSSFLIIKESFNKDKFINAILNSKAYKETKKWLDGQKITIDNLIDYFCNKVAKPVDPKQLKNYRTLDYDKYDELPIIKLMCYNGIKMKGSYSDKNAKKKYIRIYNSIKTDDNTLWFILLGQDEHEGGLWLCDLFEDLFLEWQETESPVVFKLLNWRP